MASFLRPAVMADLSLHASEPYNTWMACLVATRRRPIVFQPPEDPRQRPTLHLKGGYMRRLNMWFRRYRADLVALLVVTIWGISAPFRKAALAEFDVMPFTALRFLGMLVLSWDSSDSTTPPPSQTPCCLPRPPSLPRCCSGDSSSNRLVAHRHSVCCSHCWGYWSLSGRRSASASIRQALAI